MTCEATDIIAVRRRGGGARYNIGHLAEFLAAWIGASWGAIDGTLADQADLAAALSDKAASSHGHAVADTTGLQTALDGKAATGHGHAISDTSGLQTALDGKAASGHNHDAAYAPISHGHAATGISDSTATGRAVLTAADAPAVRTAIGAGTSSFSGAYNDLSGKPSLGDAAAKNTGTIAGTVAAGDHTHPGGSAAWGGITGTLSDQSDLQTELNGKESANANIQAHVAQAHAPAGAQANADITKAEIEAKLTGVISSHSHAGGGAAMLCIPLVADAANFALTNMAAALGFLGASHRFATKVDLTNFTQVRLIVNKQGTAGAAASKIILRYRTAFDATPANWLDIGTSEVNCAINVQNTVIASAWINLAALAKADVFVAPLMSGGDGALDPVLGSVVAQFK